MLLGADLGRDRFGGRDGAFGVGMRLSYHSVLRAPSPEPLVPLPYPGLF